MARPMRPFVPLATTQDRLRAGAVFGGIAAVTTLAELRNPLAAIRGAADVVAAGIPKGSRDEEFGRILLSEVQRLDGVVSDFLQFARPGRAGEDFADPALCAKATFTLLRPQAEKAGV